MIMYTYWDEEAGRYLLTEKGATLTERGMINVIGELESALNNQKRKTKQTTTSIYDDFINGVKDLKPIDNIQKEDKKNIQHTCGCCKYEYVPPDCYPCNACVVYGRTDPREDLWEEKENER